MNGMVCQVLGLLKILYFSAPIPNDLLRHAQDPGPSSPTLDVLKSVWMMLFFFLTTLPFSSVPASPASIRVLALSEAFLSFFEALVD
jgi:hypothetical protein